MRAVGNLSGPGRHAFSALNLATLQDGVLLEVAAGTRLELPIELLHVTSKAVAGRSLRPRHLIQMAEGSSATLRERFLSLDDAAYFTNLVCEVSLAEGASLHHQRVQNESLQAYHLSELHVDLAGDAHYHGLNVALGAAWSRTDIHSRFNAAGGHCELDGLYLAGERQLVDFHLDIDHAVPGCESRENFKGILHGAGRAVFDGRILVREQAQKTSAHLANDNLMLSRRAEIDTKPQLEILADDVSCSHGTTVGQLDPLELFYMRSRGMSEKLARRLLCLGFAAEVLERFPEGSLQRQLTEIIRDRLEPGPSGQSDD